MPAEQSNFKDNRNCFSFRRHGKSAKIRVLTAFRPYLFVFEEYNFDGTRDKAVLLKIGQILCKVGVTLLIAGTPLIVLLTTWHMIEKSLNMSELSTSLAMLLTYVQMFSTYIAIVVKGKLIRRVIDCVQQIVEERKLILQISAIEPY